MHFWGCEATRSWEKMCTSWKANRYSRADGLTSWRWPCRPCRSLQPPTSCHPPFARHCRRRPRRPLSSRAEPTDSSSRGAAGSRRRGGGGSERWRWRVWWTRASAATPRPPPAVAVACIVDSLTTTVPTPSVGENEHAPRRSGRDRSPPTACD
ncbi:hypothetical protein BU14_0107s0011 [Porphyra umbilicalis]|uniref:Uncharacterized protein n=1 Tax=Porphyra umbilicalis TaxID=2786 RepID=A0A1X6PCA5_PORUM|nr:hypothetical protein BU14_0107s0011 [Porphyra umbilicalis]|eukprot:OSX78502.1 hypothetical protein BU14_0107s0011 [Porphyra umbilicalis]